MRASSILTGLAAICGLVAATATGGTAGATTVTTYHYDNLRTGWDQNETVLTPKTVSSAAFGLIAQVPLDEQVDGQPLYVGGQVIGGSAHNVAYVATEGDTVYAIDANTGAVLLSRNLGTPVPMSALPGGCNNNSNNIGVNSTPVIDAATGTLYLIADTFDNGTTPTFRIHALDLATLADKVAPVVVSATGTLADGNSFSLNAASARQRVALLETGGNIYAGFGSFCDSNSNVSRGWVLGWKAGTLAPLPANHLNNQVGLGRGEYLTSIWMSGYGLASDDKGSLFFVTGNSDRNTYDPSANLAESVIRLSSDLTTVQSYFTPGNHAHLDAYDEDFGSGGVLLLPDQAGAYPHLAVAAGKGDALYLLNRDNLGGEAAHPPALQAYANPGCWCGQSYYVGDDGVGRVVTSLGQNVVTWRVRTQPVPALVQESSGPGLASGQDPGFFTVISSNGTEKGSAIVWAMPHPDDADPAHTIRLAAMDPALNMHLLFHAGAGFWPFAGNANANQVPLVADGHVFVAAYKQLAIFGLSSPAAHVALVQPPAPVMRAYPGAPHDLHGIVVENHPGGLTLRTRTGATVSVDVRDAEAAGNLTEIKIGDAALIRGDTDHAGNFVAKAVLHQKKNVALWAPDR